MKNIILIPALLLAFASTFTTNLVAQETETPAFMEFVAQFPKAELPYSFATEDLKGQLEANTAAKA
jgi:hypothetical protein